MATEVRVTYYDAAMAAIEVGGLRLLTDPVMDAAGAIFDDGAVRLVKTADPAVAPDALGRIDAVLLSHDQHADNLDAGGRAFLARVSRVLTTPAGAARLGGSADGLSPWEATTLTGVDGTRLRITAVPAQHAPDGLEEATGPVTGFIVETEDMAVQPIYISGDTIPFAGTAEVALRYAPIGLAILHVGRAKVAPLGDVSVSMGADEAASLALMLRASAVIPIHFEGWEHFTEGRSDAQPAFEANGLAGVVHWLDRGEAAVLQLPAR